MPKGKRGGKGGTKAAKTAATEKPKKKTFSAFIKGQRDKDLRFFFGDDYRAVSNKYIKFTHFRDDDNITIVTNNITDVKGNKVLVIGNNSAVYLKDWQVRPVHNYDNGINAYAVRLSRKYFRPYTFRSGFNGYSFPKDDTFDSLIGVAKAQDKSGMTVAMGHMG